MPRVERPRAEIGDRRHGLVAALPRQDVDGLRRVLPVVPLERLERALDFLRRRPLPGAGPRPKQQRDDEERGAAAEHAASNVSDCYPAAAVRYAVPLLLLAGACASPARDPMPLARVFEQPWGQLPQRLAFSPDGRTVAGLLAREADGLADLWAWDPETGEGKILLEAPGRQRLSAEEEAARERRRDHVVGIGAFEWNPRDGTILVPLSGDLHVLRDGRLERLTHTDEAELDPRWSPDGRSIAFVRDGALHVLRDGVETALTPEASGKTRCGVAEFIAAEELGRHEGFWWSPDSTRIAYVRTESQQVPLFHMHDYLAPRGEPLPQEYPRAGDPNVLWWLCVVPAAGGEPTVMKVDGEYLVRVDWMPDGGLAVQVADRPQRRLTLHRCDPATGEARALLEETDDRWVAFHDDLRFLRDGRFLWSSERSGRRHLYVGGRGGLRPITSGPWDVAGVVHVDEAKGVVHFMGSRDGPLERHLYRVRLDGSGLARVTRERGWHGVDASRDGRRFVDTWSRATAAPAIAVLDADGATRAVLGRSAPVALPEPEFVTVPAADGTPLRGMLWRPRRYDRGPAIVHTYGGPGSQLVADRFGGATALWHARMVARGYTVFVLDNRGCGGYGRDACRRVSGRLCQLEAEDQRAGALWLARQEGVDARRIGIWGWSYGGTMALQCLLEAADAFAAGVAVAPVTDWRDYDTAYTERYLGLPDENPEGFAKGSPVTRAHELERPLLLVHGFRDDNVHFRGAVAFLDRAQQAGRAIEADFYPRGAHGIGDKNVRKLLFRRIERFFDEALAGGGR